MINGNLIMFQAIGAALRGESPQSFLKNLAKQHPQLKRINYEDLQGSAQQLAQQNGMSIDEVTKQIDQFIEPFANK